ncbi:MAG: BrnA antitoxin family protein [Bacteriovoracales bacterium]|nr:BrnA antitoxin family protein [Bacteriovoracales bacterium]
MNTTLKKNIKLSKKNVLANDEFDPKYGKERITIFLDQQVVNAFREMASADKGYQTLIREALRDYIFGSTPNDITSRLDRLERIVLKKA